MKGSAAMLEDLFLYIESSLAVETNTIESSVVSWIGIALQWHRV